MKDGLGGNFITALADIPARAIPGWPSSSASRASAPSATCRYWNWWARRLDCPASVRAGGATVAGPGGPSAGLLRQGQFDVPTTRALVERLGYDPQLRRLCGWECAAQCPARRPFRGLRRIRRERVAGASARGLAGAHTRRPRVGACLAGLDRDSDWGAA